MEINHRDLVVQFIDTLKTKYNEVDFTAYYDTDSSNWVITHDYHNWFTDKNFCDTCEMLIGEVFHKNEFFSYQFNNGGMKNAV